MRVVMLLRCLSMMRGGGETQHLAWARELERLGDEVEIISGRPLLRPARFGGEAGFRIRELRTPYTRDLVYRVQGKRVVGRIGSWALHVDEELFLRAAWSHIASLSPQPDVVHAHALHQAARLRRGSAAVVVNMFGPPHPRYTRDLRKADALTSDGWGAIHLPAILGALVEDVPKGVDVEVFAPDGPDHRRRLGLHGQPVILGVGRFVPIKRFDVLLDAFGRVVAAEKDAVLILAGEGPDLARLKSRAQAAGFLEHVRFVGHVPQMDLSAWYRTADVFALSSEFDNAPNVVMEAMACGLPVVSSDVGGVAQYVRQGVNGELVPPGAVQEMADAILGLIRDTERRRLIGEANRDEVLRRYSWDASARALHRVYEQAIQRSGLAIEWERPTPSAHA